MKNIIRFIQISNKNTMNRLTIFFISTLVILLTSCSTSLIGTWKVDKFQTYEYGQSGSVLSDIGTVRFDKDGSGQKDLRYTLMNMTVTDNMPFKWIVNDNTVTLLGEKSDLIKTWIIVENGSSYQKWQSTDGFNLVQTLILKKVKE